MEFETTQTTPEGPRPDTQPNNDPNRPGANAPVDEPTTEGNWPTEDDNVHPTGTDRQGDPNRENPYSPTDPEKPMDPENDERMKEQEKEITEKTIPFPKPGN